MNAQTTTAPGLHSITVSRTERGFVVRWQREGRPTRREFTDLGSAIGQAYTLASMLDMPVLDRTAEHAAEG